MITKQIILDHGYIELIETWGSDERIIEAARMSTNKGFLGWGEPAFLQCPTCGYRLALDLIPSEKRGEPIVCGSPAHDGTQVVMVLQIQPPGDEKLLRYLYVNKHHTPFEMAGMTIEVQAPIFVFREWHRHRTQSYNELSARYTPLPDINYMPSVERCAMTGTSKQAQPIVPSTGAVATPEQLSASHIDWLNSLANFYTDAEALYKNGLMRGIPKEIARVCLPVGRYSRMRASANLRNWLLFLTLRMDEHAQWEIRQYANAVGKLVEQRFPRTWQLFVESTK